MNTIAEIVQKLGSPAKRLYQEGIPYHAYLTELTWLWLLKIMPTVKPGNTFSPTHRSWETLTQKQGWQQLEYYQEIISQLRQVNDPQIAGIYAHARTVFKHPEQLREVISALTSLDEVMPEEWGEIYEILLEEESHQQGGYLQIVPRCLIDLIVILTQPQLGELIQDPLAGTASFIVAADQYIQVTSETEDYEGNLLKTSNFIALEPDLIRQRLALMNCLLHQINSSPAVSVQWGDSLLSNQEVGRLAEVIFSVLVFTRDPNQELGKQDTALALLQHIYQSLKPGGRAAVILSDNVLRAAGPAQQVRTTLLNTCVLHTVLRLPHGIFYPYKIPAHVLFFWRSHSSQEQTEQVWFYDARTGFPTFGQYLRLNREHLRPFEIAYGDDPLGQSARHDEGEGKRWRCFSRDAIAKQGDRLDLCWLLEEKSSLDNKVSSQNIWEVLDETVEELEFLSTLLRS